MITVLPTISIFSVASFRQQWIFFKNSNRSSIEEANDFFCEKMKKKPSNIPRSNVCPKTKVVHDQCASINMRNICKPTTLSDHNVQCDSTVWIKGQLADLDLFPTLAF